ncbi:hypothetical protein [Halarchaeum salinum]
MNCAFSIAVARSPRVVEAHDWHFDVTESTTRVARFEITDFEFDDA